jgi:hypothetical protein
MGGSKKRNDNSKAEAAKQARRETEAKKLRDQMAAQKQAFAKEQAELKAKQEADKLRAEQQAAEEKRQAAARSESDAALRVAQNQNLATSTGPTNQPPPAIPAEQAAATPQQAKMNAAQAATSGVTVPPSVAVAASANAESGGMNKAINKQFQSPNLSGLSFGGA